MERSATAANGDEGRVSLAEFNALADQTRRMQARLETLELQQNEEERGLVEKHGVQRQSCHLT